ncbi:MAG: PQQ-binding-like beta-propeller repeat protein [Verrucomicrobiota bacterium]
MKPTAILIALLCLTSRPAGALEKTDWPWWRGPHHNGIAEADQDLPLTFSETENLHWATPIPGRGHGSVSVFGDRLFLAIADEKKQTQGLLCLDRETGMVEWSRELHRGGFPKANKKASHASSSPACDGERVIISFLNHNGVHTTALDLDGKQLWQTRITDYVLHQGYGASPFIYKSLVLIAADNKGNRNRKDEPEKKGGVICGLDRKTGKVVWSFDRPALPNYPSPVVHHIDGRDQLIMTGCERVTSLDPLTGEKLWEAEGATTECVTTTVTDGERIFTSGGYPRNHVAAMAADGSGKIHWDNISRVYVPSMLLRDNHLYAVMDAGFAVCWKSDTGERLWKKRLGGDFSASPVMVGNHIYAANEKGDFFVLRATPEG